MNRCLHVRQHVSIHTVCPYHVQQTQSRCSRHSRRAAAAAVCAQEPAAGGSADPASGNSFSTRGSSPSSSSSSSSRPQPGQQWPNYTPSSPIVQIPASDNEMSTPTTPAVAGSSSSSSSRRTAGSSLEAALSRHIQAADSWQGLASVLLEYSAAMQHTQHANTYAVHDAAQLQHGLPLQQQQQQQRGRRQHPQHQHQHQHQRQEQQTEELSIALRQLNNMHLARLLKALVRLQPSSHLSQRGPSGPAAAGTANAQPHSAEAGGTAGSWSKQDQQAFWTFVQLAFSECMEQLPSLTAWDLSSSLWAASKLAQGPSPFLLRRLLQQMAQPSILAAATAQDVSMSLYAVASLAVQVPEQQLDVLLSATVQQVHRAPAQALANTLWAVASLQHRPQEEWLRLGEGRCASILHSSSSSQQQQDQQPEQPLSHSSVQQQHQHQGQQQQQQRQQRWAGDSFTAHGLYQLMWALAKLQWQPTAAFQAGFWFASLSQLPHMTPHGVTGVLWAVASLALFPPKSWTDGWLAGLRARMEAGVCGPQDLGNALWAVVRLDLQPDEAWLQVALRATQQVMGSAGTQELSNILWSLAKLGVKPDAAWMHSWLSAMQARMGSYCAPALASSAYALALLRYRPPRSWVQSLLLETQRQMPAFGAQELSNLVWALAVLDIQPGAAWFRDFQVQTVHEAGSFNALELSMIFWALAKLGHTPPAPWVAGLLREGLEVSGGLQAQPLVLLLGSLTRWDLPKMHTAGHYRVLLPRYWAAAQQLLPQCTLAHLSVLYAARAKLGVLPSKQWSSSFWSAVQDRLAQLMPVQQPCADAGDSSSTATSDSSDTSIVNSSSAGKLPGSQQLQHAASGSSPQEQQQALVQALRALPAGVLKPAVVSELTWAAGKLWGQAPVDFATLQLLMASAAAVVPACSFQLLTAIGIGIKHMVLGTKQLEQRQARRTGVRRFGTKRYLRTQQQQQTQQTHSSVHRHRQQTLRDSKTTHTRQHRRKPCSTDSSSSSRRLARARSRRRTQQKAGVAKVTLLELQQLTQPVWDAWFARSTQLLLQAQAAAAAAAVAAAAQAQQRMEVSAVPAASILQQPLPAASILQQPAHQPQQPQQALQPAAAKPSQHQQGAARGLLLSCKDVSMQLRLAAALKLRPDACWWLAAVAVAKAGIGSSTAEALSWLLLDLIKVQKLLQQPCEQQLPQGFVWAVLQRVRVLHEGRVGWSPMQMLRMQSAMRRLREGGVVSVGEWQQWQQLLGVWRANHGISTVGQ